jgi:hypothetical protein
MCGMPVLPYSSTTSLQRGLLSSLTALRLSRPGGVYTVDGIPALQPPTAPPWAQSD